MNIVVDHAPRFLLLQAAYAAIVAGVIAVVVATPGVVDAGGIPAWYGWALVVMFAVWSIPTTLYWRIRPIAHGRVHDYRATIVVRMGVAVIPFLIGVVFYALGGGWGVVVAGGLAALIGLMASVPSSADYTRHRQLWDEPPPMPADHVWGAAGPDDLAPWEDPDDHGHALFDHH